MSKHDFGDKVTGIGDCLIGSLLRPSLWNPMCNSSFESKNALGVFCSKDSVSCKSRAAFNHVTTSLLGGPLCLPHFACWEGHCSVMPVSTAKLSGLRRVPTQVSSDLLCACERLNPGQQMCMKTWNYNSEVNFIFIFTFMGSFPPRIAG